MQTPLVTTAPVGVDIAQFAGSQELNDGPGCPCGPFFVTGAKDGDAWYIVQEYSSTGNPNNINRVGVFKCSDPAAGPWDLIATSATLAAGIWNVYWPKTGTTIYLAGWTIANLNSIAAQSFDCSTDTLALASASLAATGVNNSQSFFTARQTGGTQWAFWDNDAGNGVLYASLTAGVWSAIGSLTGPIVGVLNSPYWYVLADSTDVCHGFYKIGLNDADNTATLYYFRISAAGVVSAPAAIYAGTLTAGTNCSRIGVHQAAIIGGRLYVPFGQGSGGGSATYQTCVMVGSNLAAPVWTMAVVDDGTTVPSSSYQLFGGFLAAQDRNGKPCIFWYVTPSLAVSTNQIWMSTSSSGGLKWGAPVLFFDNTVTPIPDETFRSVMRNGYMNDQTANGLWYFNTAFFLNGDNPLITFTGVGAIAVTQPGDAGRKPVPIAPNQFDWCLHREFRVFQQIDYERLGCGRLPSCFRMDEREWGGWE